MKHQKKQAVSARCPKWEWCLGVGDICTTQRGKQVHLRYLSNEPLVQAGLLCCAAGCVLSAKLLKAQLPELLWMRIRDASGVIPQENAPHRKGRIWK